MTGDAPIFDPVAFRLDAEQNAIIARARDLAAANFAPRAAQYDREAKFPVENYRDLHEAGLLGHLHPKIAGRARRQLPDVLARRRRDRPLLRRHRADLEHACLLHPLVRRARRRSWRWMPTLAPSTTTAVVSTTAASSGEGAIYSQPFSEGGAAAAGAAAFGTEAHPALGGWRVSGKKIFASLVRPCRLLRHPLHRDGAGRQTLPPQHALSRHPRHRRSRRAASSATGTRLGCAAPSRARCCSTTSSCHTTPR